MSPAPMPLPERFGRYEVQSLLGEGSMGRVYRAFDPLARRVVAIKTLKAEYLTSETRDDYMRRFRREAQAAGALSHPNIVTIFDVGEDFFVMELLGGATLQAILRERGRLDPPDALRVLGPVAEAIDHAHSQGTIHRDIKPGNIMVLPDGRPKVMDFGVAHLTSTVMTAAGQFLGSPSYMSPEQITEAQVSPASDVFSLAVVAYEVVTGRKPFEGESITTIIYKVVHEEPVPPRQWNLDLAPRYDDVFRRALAKEPSLRYPTATALLAALEMKEIDAVLELDLVTTASSVPLPSPPDAIETVDLKVENAAKSLPLPPAGAPAGAARSRAPRRVVRRVFLLASVLALVAGAAVLRDPELQSQLGSVLSPVLQPFLGRTVEPGPPALAPPVRPHLRIETEPPGASVFLDEKEVGTSPLSVRSVVQGPHTVRVTRDGFASAQVSLELVAGLAHGPVRFVLHPTSARLSVVSTPEGAGVWLDGREAGPAPLTGVLLDIGPHELRVERKGYRAWTRHLEARAGESLELEAHLDRADTGHPAPKPTPVSVAALGEGHLVALTEDVTPPRKVSGDTPPYPAAARGLRLQGLVVADMVVSEKGEPTDIRIVESAGEILDQAVLDAVRNWRFEPAEKAGIKVRVRWQMRQRFELQR